MNKMLTVGTKFSGIGKIPILGGSRLNTLNSIIKAMFASNEQGFAYDPNDLTDAKLNWRRNLLTSTEDFTAAAWVKVDTTLVKDNIANPFGALGVFKLCPNKQTLPPSDSDIRQTVSKKGSGVFSVYLKKAERNFACINVLGRNPTGSEGRLIVDLTTKAINRLGLQRDFIVQEVGDGWLRVALLFENFVSLDVEVRVQVAENINTFSTTGDGTRGIYAYAPQLEFFTDAPSTYQPITDFNSEFIKQFPLHTLYQDAAGTIPVTAAGQPVGLMLDKSKGLSLSAELFTAALDFNNWSRTVAVTSVTANSFTTNGFGGCIKNPITTGMSLTKAYQVRIFGTCNVAHKIRSSSTYVGEVSVPAGAFDVTIKSPITFADSSMYFQLQAAGTITVNSISIKELAGNHAYQTVSASRPVLQRNATTGAYYLAFDGVDDFLRTNNIDFTATDKVSLFAGVRKLSDATVAMFLEYSQNVNTNIGGFNITAPNGTTATTYATNINGGSAAGRSAGGYVAPISNVLSLHLDTSKNNVVTGVMVRINGITPALSGTGATGTGNYGNYPLYIGRRGGTSLPFNGHLYSLIGISRLTTDSETIALEKSIAKNTGVTLNV